MNKFTATVLLLSVFSSTDAFSTVSPLFSQKPNSLPTTAPPFSSTNNDNGQSQQLRIDTTALNSVPVPVGAIAGAISGGVFAGGLHAIAGE